MLIPDCIRGATSSPVTYDLATAWPLCLVMDMCHLPSTVVSTQDRAFCIHHAVRNHGLEKEAGLLAYFWSSPSSTITRFCKPLASSISSGLMLDCALEFREITCINVPKTSLPISLLAVKDANTVEECVESDASLQRRASASLIKHALLNPQAQGHGSTNIQELFWWTHQNAKKYC